MKLNKSPKDVMDKANKAEIADILLDILGILRAIAFDQATREFSGGNWFEEIDKRINKIREKVDREIQF